MKIKKYLGTALAIGGTLTILGLSGCATPKDADGTSMRVSNPESVVYGVTPNTARSLVELLKDEFDYVNYMTKCAKRDEKNNCLEEDYVIRGHKNSGHMKIAVWGLNLSNVCKAYTMGIPILDYITGDDIYADMSDGSVIGYRMTKSVAEILAESLEVLAKSKKNTERCEEWGKMIVKNYGLFGPAN